MTIGDFLFVLSDMTNATINMQYLAGYSATLGALNKNAAVSAISISRPILLTDVFEQTIR
ncbi:MAG TPA: hypothetical protein VJ552_08640 [Sediminibacterium sp.]|nr:hypothetical protein [Sediminibacterium sp.]